MRFLHLADGHLGLRRHSRPGPGGVPTSLASVGRCWVTACEIAEDKAVDLVLVAGDTFHTPDPDHATLASFDAGLRILEAAGIPVVVLAGNHDGKVLADPIVGHYHSPPRIYGVARPGVVDVDGIRVACLPHVGRHQLMAAHPGILREEADDLMEDGLRRVLDLLRSEGADILTGHWTVLGGKSGAERDLSVLVGEPVLHPADLDGPWRYVALGHLHSGQEVPNEAVPIVYAGSLDRVDFGEEGDIKAAVEVEISGSEPVRLTYHELPARRFVTLDLAAFTADEFPDVEGAIVRLKDSVDEDQAAALDQAGIQKVLYAAGAEIAYVQLEIRRKDRRRLPASQGASFTPIDALEHFFRTKNVPEEQRGPLRDLLKELTAEVGA